MAATVTHLPLVKLPTGPAPLSPEQRYWRSFKHPKQLPAPSRSPVTSISSVAHLASVLHSSSATGGSASASGTIAVTAGPRVLLLDSRGETISRQIARFPATAHGVHFRPSDGRVLAAGDESGGIQVFDAQSRAILRTWRSNAQTHRQGVWVTRFSPHDPTALLSASDDGTVREWDLAAEDSVRTFTGHGDYVRAAAYLPGPSAAGLIVSGSYDQTVKIWDPRAPNRAVLSFQHDAPLEAVIPTPAGTTVLSAAGNQICVLDLVGARPLRILENHQKTVTALCLASKDTQLVSGSLDGHVKIFETSGWNLVAGFKYPSPILALDVTRHGIAGDDRHLVVGMQSGIISVKTRFSGQQKARERTRQKEMDALVRGDEESTLKGMKRKAKSMSEQSRHRVNNYDGEGADTIIDGNPIHEKRAKLSAWQVRLRQGKYAAALDLVLESQDPSAVVTLLVALRHRQALNAALSGRDEVTLQPLLRWIRKHLVNPRYVNVSVEVTTQLICLYAGHVGQSPEVDDLLRGIHEQVRREIERAQQAWQTTGMLGLLMKT